MRETQYITLELYLDGELSTQERAELEQQLAEDTQLAEALAHLKQARSLRRAALQTYMPDATEARRLAANAIAFCHEHQYSPLQRIFTSYSSSVWSRRIGLAAACVLIAVSSYWAGRGSVLPATQTATASSIVGYTVKISTPSGQIVSQTFATYQQAKDFAQTYTADEQAVSNQSTTAPQLASASDTGTF